METEARERRGGGGEKVDLHSAGVSQRPRLVGFQLLEMSDIVMSDHEFSVCGQ